jgi:hypothetical protein
MSAFAFFANVNTLRLLVMIGEQANFAGFLPTSRQYMLIQVDMALQDQERRSHF